MHAQNAHAEWIRYAITAAIFLVIFALRGRQILRVRPLRIDQLWIVPAIYLVVVAVLFVRVPPSAAGWGVAAIGLVIGGALGWQRGKTMRIHIDPETGVLQQKGSIWAFLMIVVLVAVKTIAQNAGSALHFDVNILVDGLAALSLGVFAVQRLEMYLRASRLLADADADAARRPVGR